VRKELDVLVPLYLLAAFRPFEVELLVMKLDVGPDEIRGDVAERRLDQEVPIERMMLDRARQAAQPRPLRANSLSRNSSRAASG
jgi:hypothetical protein